jgi:predicted nuclease of restriction endonuclease-like RecB superfamily
MKTVQVKRELIEEVIAQLQGAQSDSYVEYTEEIIDELKVVLKQHHKEQTRVREYVYLRADQHTSVDTAVMQASEHFDMSIEDVQAILYKADMRGDNE